MKQEPERLDREQLLQVDPVELFRDGVEGKDPNGLAPRLGSEGAAALIEQLKAEGTPRVGLDQVFNVFSRAADAQGKTDSLERSVLDRLKRDLGLQTKRSKVLLRWSEALHERIDSPEQLRGACRFLERVHTVWKAAEAGSAPR